MFSMVGKMCGGERRENVLPGRGQRQCHAPSIVGRAATLDKAVGRKPIDQLDSAVDPNEQGCR